MLWIKALHIVLVTSWFAGLFYLPRIFVNLAIETDPSATNRLLTMAHKLYRFMIILMVPALIFGFWLWLGYGFGKAADGIKTAGWLHAKLLIVLLLIGYQHGCGVLLKKFSEGRNTRSHIWFRWFNEIPVLLLILAVILVVVKPF